MTQWQQLVFQNGKIMAVFMVALPAFWLVILIAAPQLMMIDFSLWYEDNVTLERLERDGGTYSFRRCRFFGRINDW